MFISLYQYIIGVNGLLTVKSWQRILWHFIFEVFDRTNGGWLRISQSFPVQPTDAMQCTVDHGFYGSIQAVVQAMGHVNGRWWFSTPHSSETPQSIFMKLEIYNCLPDTIRQAKFQGNMSTWVVWANSQFDAWKLCPVFLSSRPQVTSCLHTQYAIIRRFRQGSAFWESERWNLKFYPDDQKQQKLNVINYKHETHASAYAI